MIPDIEELTHADFYDAWRRSPPGGLRHWAIASPDAAAYFVHLDNLWASWSTIVEDILEDDPEADVSLACLYLDDLDQEDSSIVQSWSDAVAFDCVAPECAAQLSHTPDCFSGP